MNYSLVNGANLQLKNNAQNSIKSKSEQMALESGNSSDKLNWLIHLQHIRGETGACKELIKNEIEKSGGRNEYAIFKQGIVLKDEGKIQEALESFQTCLKLNPENVDNLKEIAKCLYEMRRFRLSLEAYLEAEKVSKYPDSQIYYNIGHCLMRLGDVGKAKDYAERSVQLSKHETSYTLLIKILITEGDLKSASAICNAAVESCPDSVSMLTESGILHLKLGQTEHAFEKFSSALALDSNCSKALLGVGCITQSHNEHDVALTKYKLAILHEPESVALWNNIGMCFYSKQKFVAAISCLKRALWISPMNWRVLFNLGLAHLATFQPASAFNFLCAAVNLRPDVPQIFTTLGCDLLELKDPDNSIRAFKQALHLTSEDLVIIINTALSFALSGQVDETLELIQRFQIVLERNPDNIVHNKEAIELADHLRLLLSSKIQVNINEGNLSEIMSQTNTIDENGDDLVDRTLAPDEV